MNKLKEFFSNYPVITIGIIIIILVVIIANIV